MYIEIDEDMYGKYLWNFSLLMISIVDDYIVHLYTVD